jgi:hypothetical protein
VSCVLPLHAFVCGQARRSRVPAQRDMEERAWVTHSTIIRISGQNHLNCHCACALYLSGLLLPQRHVVVLPAGHERLGGGAVKAQQRSRVRPLCRTSPITRIPHPASERMSEGMIHIGETGRGAVPHAIVAISAAEQFGAVVERTPYCATRRQVAEQSGRTAIVSRTLTSTHSHRQHAHCGNVRR